MKFKVFVKITNQSFSLPENEIFEFKTSNNKFICSINRKLLEDSYPDIYENYCRIEEFYLLKYKVKPEIIQIALSKNQIDILRQDIKEGDWTQNISSKAFEWYIRNFYNYKSEYWKAPSITFKENINIENNYSNSALKDAEHFSSKLYKFLRSL